MEEDEAIIQDEPDGDVFELGDAFISQSELDQLLSSEDPKDKERLKSIIILAATNDNYDVTIHLLSQGYQLEVLNDKNQTITHLAYYVDTHSGTFWSGGLAFSKSENHTNYVDSNGLSHLHIACATGYVDVVKQFLNNGEDIESRLTADCNRDKSGFTPLHFAVTHHEIEIVKLLLERGADIDAADSSGCTPLHLACSVSWIFKKSTNLESLKESTLWNSELDILKLLLKYKSDLDARDVDGNTPLLRIFQNDYYYQRRNGGLLDTDFKVKDELASHLQIRQLKKLNILFKHRPNFAVKNNNDESILHCVIGDLKFTRFPVLPLPKFLNDEIYASLVQLLLRENKELDVNAKNKRGETPISLAISLVSYELVKTLFDNNADLNSIQIHDQSFFKYPNIVPTMDIVSNLQSILSLLVDKGFNLTLEVNLRIMKFLMHDVTDCDCGNVNHGDCLPIASFFLISHCSPRHLKQIVTNILDSFSDESKFCLLQSCRIFLEYCKLIPYSVPMDEEIVQMIYENSQAVTDHRVYQPLIQSCEEDVSSMKSTKLKNGVTFYDMLTKYLHKENIFNYFELDDVATALKKPMRGLLVCGQVKESMVRAYVESSAFKNYVALLLPCLPDLCRKMILTYLETEDILRLCEASILE